ncbi:MAG: hypothetical protein KJ648_07700 [Candidatus Omnitrophica bacterium]|nr:hypothetical protein [Candidatus Omnitrophota bacterium]
MNINDILEEIKANIPLIGYGKAVVNEFVKMSKMDEVELQQISIEVFGKILPRQAFWEELSNYIDETIFSTEQEKPD